MYRVDTVKHTRRLTFLIEDQRRIVSFVTIELIPQQTVTIQDLAVLNEPNRAVYVASLIRWSETLARQSDCERIHIWVLSNELGHYRAWGFDKDTSCLARGDAIVVSRPVTYHINDPRHL